MRLLTSNLSAWLAVKPTRYLIAGAWNTAFGYAIGVLLYLLLIQDVGIVWVGILANVISITMSFVVYKLFVFQTKGNWLREYLRSYVVYGGSGALSIVLLWLLVGQLGFNIWIGQAAAILLVVLASYIGHARFTFKEGGNIWRRS